MFKHLHHTKLIITVGFIAIISFAIVGIILIYMELVKFSKTSDTSEMRKELVIIGNTLASMYRLEGASNFLITKSTTTVLAESEPLMRDVVANIDTLKEVSQDPLLKLRLDTIINLLETKQKNTLILMQLVDSVEKKSKKEVTKTTVLSKKDIDDLDRLINNITKSSEDTAIVKSNKKGFFERVKSVFNSQTDSAMQISKNRTEEVNTITVPTLTDTITQYLSDIVQTNNRKQNVLMGKLISRQQLLHSTNEKITLQINRIMREMESSEYQTSLKLMKEKEIAFNHSFKIMGVIGLLALFTTLLFLGLSYRSITHGQRYRKEIEKLLADRERLILTITHDIKAPISSIIGYIELLFKSKPQGKEQYYLENMQSSSEHILELVKNLLDYHALESDKEKMNQMPFFPYTLLNDIYHSFIPLSDKKNLNFQFKSSIDKTQNFISDPYRIRQIANNLISNAIKFTPEGGTIAFKISLSNTGEQTWLSMSVKDDGHGISDQNKQIIFEEFSRLQGGAVEGSGLGLPITKKLVLLLNGTISIISNLEEGSEFIVRIPLEKNTGRVTPEFKQQEESISFTVNPDKKVLFIDDDKVMLNLVSELLKREGFTPITCANSIDALSLLQKTRFDMVFTDIQMPDMNGFELVERIRMATFEGSKSIPVIALSGNSNISELKFMEAGFSAFLPKPFTSRKLLEIMQLYLGENINSEEEDSGSKGFSVLVNFAGDDLEAASAIIQSFIDENKKNIGLLDKAFAEEDYNTIKNVCHKMLPLMRMVSGGEIVSILSDYEKGLQESTKRSQLMMLIKNQIRHAELFLSELNATK